MAIWFRSERCRVARVWSARTCSPPTSRSSSRRDAHSLKEPRRPPRSVIRSPTKFWDWIEIWKFHAWLALSWPNWVGNFWTIHRTVPTCLHPTFTFFDHSSTFWTSESFETLSICVENWLLSLHQRIEFFGVAVSICCRKNGRMRLILMEHTLINVVLCFLLVYAINFVNFWHSLKT